MSDEIFDFVDNKAFSPEAVADIRRYVTEHHLDARVATNSEVIRRYGAQCARSVHAAGVQVAYTDARGGRRATTYYSADEFPNLDKAQIPETPDQVVEQRREYQRTASNRLQQSDGVARKFSYLKASLNKGIRAVNQSEDWQSQEQCQGVVRQLTRCRSEAISLANLYVERYNKFNEVLPRQYFKEQADKIAMPDPVRQQFNAAFGPELERELQFQRTRAEELSRQREQSTARVEQALHDYVSAHPREHTAGPRPEQQPAGSSLHLGADQHLGDHVVWVGFSAAGDRQGLQGAVAADLTPGTAAAQGDESKPRARHSSRRI